MKYFKYLPAEYPKLNLIFCGDFNLPETHSVFNPLKLQGYNSLLKGQKTTLREKPVDGDFLASEYDNIFYHKDKLKILQKGVVHFYKKFNNFDDAKAVSDHIPVFCILELL